MSSSSEVLHKCLLTIACLMIARQEPILKVPEGEQDWSRSSSPAGEAVIKSLPLLTDKLDSNSATRSALGRLRLSFLICKWG